MAEELDSGAIEAILKSGEASLRDAIGTHGPQHEEVLEKLEEYLDLLRLCGKSDEAGQLEQHAVLLRSQFGTSEQAQAATGSELPPATKPDLPASEASLEEVKTAEKHIYSSRGRHVGTHSDGHLYTPGGKHVGRWLEEYGAYVDRNGWYIGHLIDGDRLAYDRNWQFTSRNFGDKGNAGDRPGWEFQRDKERSVFPTGCEDVDVDSRLALRWRPKQLADVEGY